MEKIRSVIALVISFLILFVSLHQFIVREVFGSKIWALLFFVFSLILMISILKDMKQEKKCE